MKWIIYDESEDESTEMRLGRKTDKYEANSLKSDGSQTYTVYLSMNNVKHEEDDDKIITFNVEVCFLFLSAQSINCISYFSWKMEKLELSNYLLL